MKASKQCDQLSFLSYLFQFISVLRGKKRKESNANVEIKEINGESKAEADPGEKETALSLCPQPQPTQAPSMTNRLEFSRWVRQTVQEQIEWCRRLVDISESEDEELTYSSVVSLTDLDGPCWTRQEEWKQVSSLSGALCSVGCGCLLQVCSSVYEQSQYKKRGSVHRPLCREIFAALDNGVPEQLSTEILVGRLMGFVLHRPSCCFPRQPGVGHSVEREWSRGLCCEQVISAAWGCFVRYLRYILLILWHDSLATEELCRRVT